MENFYSNNTPCIFFGAVNSEKTQKLNHIYSELLKEHNEKEVILTDARTLINEFIEALGGRTLNQWRATLINKKYILIDDFHYFSEKVSSCEELIYIFKKTSANIILTMNNHPLTFDFGEDMNQFLASGTITSLSKWRVDIFSKAAIVEMIQLEELNNKAIISFYTPRSKREHEGTKINFEGLSKRVFYVGIPDIDIEILSDYGYTYKTYLAEADELAKFIYEAKADGLDILCQCDYGQSRSAACAAAILQHFDKRGIDIFADYRYYPNQLVYHKVFEALEKQKERGNDHGKAKENNT